MLNAEFKIIGTPCSKYGTTDTTVGTCDSTIGTRNIPNTPLKLLECKAFNISVHSFQSIIRQFVAKENHPIAHIDSH
jgi:hypothetical protein